MTGSVAAYRNGSLHAGEVTTVYGYLHIIFRHLFLNAESKW